VHPAIDHGAPVTGSQNSIPLAENSYIKTIQMGVTISFRRHPVRRNRADFVPGCRAIPSAARSCASCPWPTRPPAP